MNRAHPTEIAELSGAHTVLFQARRRAGPLPIGGAVALLAVCGATLVGLFGSWEAATARVGIPLAAIVRAFIAPKQKM